MTKKYIIVKRSRTINTVVPWAYRGPTCADAGVTPAKVYDNKAEAETDARKLTGCNPVGFVVMEAVNAD
jgi:phage-related protein